MTPDRLAWYRSICEEPRDNNRRLYFADWLDENAVGDIDVATAEFIRASCHREARHDRMPPSAYEWLKRNWPRLLPDLLAAAAFRPPRPQWQIGGRTLKVEVKLRTGPDFRCHAHVEFWRGFVANVHYPGLAHFSPTAPLVWRSQPLASARLMSCWAVTTVPPGSSNPEEIRIDLQSIEPAIGRAIAGWDIITFLDSRGLECVASPAVARLSDVSAFTSLATGLTPLRVAFRRRGPGDDPWDRTSAALGAALTKDAWKLAGHDPALAGTLVLPGPVADRRPPRADPARPIV